MTILLSLDDALELALHRALRGEIPPGVYAVAADLSARPIQLRVYGDEERLDENEEAIESEMQQCLPSGVDKSLAEVVCLSHRREEFDHGSGLRLLYLNHHAAEG